MKTIEYYIPAKEYNNKEHSHIPKKIFKTWGSNQVSDGMYNAIYTWIDKNPEWEFYLFDDAMCRDFIRDNFPHNVLESYDNIIPKAYKADLWRYCVLYIYGGVYSDIKQQLICSINDIISDDTEFLSIKDGNMKYSEFNGYIYQAFLCAKPKHIFFKNAIDMIVENSSTGEYGNDTLSITGPGLLGKAINKSLNRDLNSVILAGNHEHNSIKYEILPIQKKLLVINNNDTPFFITQYSNDYRVNQYSDINKDLSKNYGLCWFIDKCYTNGNTNKKPSKFYKKKKAIAYVEYLYIQKKFKEAKWETLKYILLNPHKIFSLRKRIRNFRNIYKNS